MLCNITKVKHAVRSEAEEMKMVAPHAPDPGWPSMIVPTPPLAYVRKCRAKAAARRLPRGHKRLSFRNTDCVVISDDDELLDDSDESWVPVKTFHSPEH